MSLKSSGISCGLSRFLGVLTCLLSYGLGLWGGLTTTDCDLVIANLILGKRLEVGVSSLVTLEQLGGGNN